MATVVVSLPVEDLKPLSREDARHAALLATGHAVAWLVYCARLGDWRE